MKNFCYVTKKEYLPVKKELIKLINLVQDEVRDSFTFNFEFIGSASRNMITRDANSNVGYDFDVNIRVNGASNYSAKEIKQILMRGFNKFTKNFKYDNCEDSKRVITIKVKDRANSKILHSCDFAVVNDYFDNDDNECQEYIHFNKRQNTYEWQEQPQGFYNLPERVDALKEEGLWQVVRERYLLNKNKNMDVNKKSRSIYAETINQIWNQYINYDSESKCNEEEEYYW